MNELPTWSIVCEVHSGSKWNKLHIWVISNCFVIGLICMQRVSLESFSFFVVLVSYSGWWMATWPVYFSGNLNLRTKQHSCSVICSFVDARSSKCAERVRYELVILTCYMRMLESWEKYVCLFDRALVPWIHAVLFCSLSIYDVVVVCFFYLTLHHVA